MNNNIYIFYSKNQRASMDIIQRLDAYLYKGNCFHALEKVQRCKKIIYDTDANT